MAYPTDLDELTDDVGTATTPLSTGHVAVHTELATVLEAVMAKVGVDSSAVTTSHDYMLAHRVATDADTTLAAGTDIALATTTGTKIGTASNQLLAFHGATPTDQCPAYTQTFSTVDRTHAARTATALTVVDGVGTNNQSIAAITADASVIAAVQELAAAINALIVDLADTASVVNGVVDDLQEKGLVG